MRKTLMIGAVAGLFVSGAEAMDSADELRSAEAAERKAHAFFVWVQAEKMARELRAAAENEEKSALGKSVDKWMNRVKAGHSLVRGGASAASSLAFSSFYGAALLPGFVSVGGRAVARCFLSPSAAFLTTGSLVSALNLAINGFGVFDKVDRLHNLAISTFYSGYKQFGDAGKRFDEALKRYREGVSEFFRRGNKEKDANTEKIQFLRQKKIDLSRKKSGISEERAVCDEEIGKLEEQQITLEQAESELLSLESDLKHQKVKYSKLKTRLTEKIANLSKEDEGYESGNENIKNTNNEKKLERLKGNLNKINEKVSELEDKGKTLDEKRLSLNNEWNNLEGKIVSLEKETNKLIREEKRLSKEVSSVNSELLWRFWGKKGMVDPALKIGSVTYSAFREGLRLVNVAYHFGEGVALCGASVLSCAVGFPSLVISCAPGFLSPLMYDALRYCGIGKINSFMITGGIASISNFMTYRSGAWNQLSKHFGEGIEGGLYYVDEGLKLLD